MARVEMDIPDEFLATYQRLAADGKLGTLSNVVCQLRDCQADYLRRDHELLATAVLEQIPDQVDAIKARHLAALEAAALEAAAENVFP